VLRCRPRKPEMREARVVMACSGAMAFPLPVARFRFPRAEAGQGLVHQRLEILNQVAELALQIVGQVLNIVPDRLFPPLFL